MRAFWSRPKTELSVEYIRKAGLVSPKFSIAQPTPTHFTLVGTLVFNVGKIEFDEGSFRFGLRTGRLHAVAKNCHFDQDTIHYVPRGPEVQKRRVETESSSDIQSGAEARAGARVSASMLSGFGAKGQAGGELTRRHSSVANRKVSGDETVIKQLTTASPKQDFDAGQTTEIEWIINYDDARPYCEGELTKEIIHGRRLHEANEAAGLAFVTVTGAPSEVEFSLDIRAVDIVPVEADFQPGSRLHKNKEQLINGRSKKAVVGRTALGKALAGRLNLQKVAK